MLSSVLESYVLLLLSLNPDNTKLTLTPQAHAEFGLRRPGRVGAGRPIGALGTYAVIVAAGLLSMFLSVLSRFRLELLRSDL